MLSNDSSNPFQISPSGPTGQKLGELEKNEPRHFGDLDLSENVSAGCSSTVKLCFTVLRTASSNIDGDHRGTGEKVASLGSFSFGMVMDSLNDRLNFARFDKSRTLDFGLADGIRYEVVRSFDTLLFRRALFELTLSRRISSTFCSYLRLCSYFRIALKAKRVARVAKNVRHAVMITALR